MIEVLRVIVCRDKRHILGSALIIAVSGLGKGELLCLFQVPSEPNSFDCIIVRLSKQMISLNLVNEKLLRPGRADFPSHWQPQSLEVPVPVDHSCIWYASESFEGCTIDYVRQLGVSMFRHRLPNHINNNIGHRSKTHVCT